MPMSSGYFQAKERILNFLADEEPKQVSRGKIASLCSVSISTAGNYLSILAEEFPENLTYTRGTLFVYSSIPEARLHPFTRMRLKEKKLQEIKLLASTIKRNHLKHKDRKKLRQAIDKLLDELEKI